MDFLEVMREERFRDDCTLRRWLTSTAGAGRGRHKEQHSEGNLHRAAPFVNGDRNWPGHPGIGCTLKVSDLTALLLSTEECMAREGLVLIQTW